MYPTIRYYYYELAYIYIQLYRRNKRVDIGKTFDDVYITTTEKNPNNIT